MNNGNGDLRID